MKINSMNESECREFDVPWFKTSEELKEFIDSLDILNNDYGTAAYAMSLAATAAFRYIAHTFGCTGFQASCADLDFIRRTRGIKGPFLLMMGEDLLYPQYNLVQKLMDFINNKDVRNWTKEQAEKMLVESKEAHPKVVEHWRMLINQGKMG